MNITNTIKDVKQNELFQSHLLHTPTITSIHTSGCVYSREVKVKMKSGVNIDCNYIIRVSKLMRIAELPRPNRKLIDSDGTILPLITVVTEE